MRRHIANTFGRFNEQFRPLAEDPTAHTRAFPTTATSSEYARTHHALLTSRAPSHHHRGVAEHPGRRIEEILQLLQQQLFARHQHSLFPTRDRTFHRRAIKDYPLPATPRFERRRRHCHQPTLRRPGLPYHTSHRTRLLDRRHVVVLSCWRQLGRPLFALWPSGQLAKRQRLKRLRLFVHYKRRPAPERAGAST